MPSRVLITGGAGFIGSHLVEALVGLGHEVVVLDRLTSRRRDNLLEARLSGRLTLVKGSCLNPVDVRKAMADCEAVFHLAADPNVRASTEDSGTYSRESMGATLVVLEEMRKSEVGRIVFASSSTVYGNAAVLPTPETYTPLEPISIYGATKLASENLISAYCHTCGMDGVVLRLANVVGGRSEHGVVVDFVRKLRERSDELAVLGDGRQAKSYVYIGDCVKGIIAANGSAQARFSVYNLGSDDQLTVRDIAKLVIETIGLRGTRVTFKGGPDGAGWKGDVKNMLLDSSKLKRLGWRPSLSSAEAIKSATRELLSYPG